MASPISLRAVCAIAAAFLGAAGCTSGQSLCAGNGDLGCVDPVSETARRVVVEPVELASIDVETEHAKLGEVVTFGSRAAGATRLYLRFGSDWKTRGTVERAFLVLAPVHATPPESREIELEVWRVREPWNREELRWSDQPGLMGPKSAAVVKPNPPAPLYIDVTELSETLARDGGEDHGISLLSKSAGTYGARFSTGAAGGLPRLELYFGKLR